MGKFAATPAHDKMPAVVDRVTDFDDKMSADEYGKCREVRRDWSCECWMSSDKGKFGVFLLQVWGW